MASDSDGEMEYLSPTFDPASLTVPRLRAILVSHDISYPSSAKKSQLIDIFTSELVPRSRKILAARSRIRRTSRGITDMPSSQESTINGDEDQYDESMAPPPLPITTERKSRRSTRAVTDESTPEAPMTYLRVTSNRKRSSKHARQSDSETDPEGISHRPSTRRSRRSEVTPTVKIEGSTGSGLRPPLHSSAFSDDNPFQSGSSPPAAGEGRRRSAGTSGDRRKSTSRRRKTEGVPSKDKAIIKQDGGVVVPSSDTFEVTLPKTRKVKIEQESDDGIGAGEEFTPEAQLEIARERAATGELQVSQSRKRSGSKTSSLLPKSAPWVVLTTLLSGYALWLRQEKLAIGYCGIGRTQSASSTGQIPEWASIIQPSCEPCPQHASCFERLETHCEQDFVLKPHPLSLGGLIPLPPTCEPDGEKVRRVKAVADRAVEELRDRNAKWECGTLVDEQGKSVATAEIDTQELKSVVAKKRRRGMSEAEFEDLWKNALGEILTRDEVTSTADGTTSTALDAPSVAPLSPGSQSAAPSSDPSDLRWRAIESALLEP